MAGAAFFIAVAFITSILKTAAKTVWGELWEKVFELVSEAESQWVGAGHGADKAAWVKSKALEWLGAQKVSLSWWQQWVASYMLGQVINALVNELNGVLGRDWVKHAKEIRQGIEGHFPFLAGGASS